MKGHSNDQRFDDCIVQPRIILKSSLTEPPHWNICFHELTLILAWRLPKGSEVLIEAPAAMKDMVWRWLKNRCAMTYVRDLVFEEDQLTGVVIDTQFDKLHRQTLIIKPLIPDYAPKNRELLLTYLHR